MRVIKFSHIEMCPAPNGRTVVCWNALKKGYSRESGPARSPSAQERRHDKRRIDNLFGIFVSGIKLYNGASRQIFATQGEAEPFLAIGPGEIVRSELVRRSTGGGVSGYSTTYRAEVEYEY